MELGPNVNWGGKTYYRKSGYCSVLDYVNLFIGDDILYIYYAYIHIYIYLYVANIYVSIVQNNLFCIAVWITGLRQHEIIDIFRFNIICFSIYSSTLVCRSIPLAHRCTYNLINFIITVLLKYWGYYEKWNNIYRNLWCFDKLIKKNSSAYINCKYRINFFSNKFQSAFLFVHSLGRCSSHAYN